MKLNKLTAACALATAALSGQAFATAPAGGAFGTPDQEIFLAGASAPQNILGGIAAELFEPGYYSYFDDGGTHSTVTTDDGVNYRAYYGVVKTSTVISVPAALVGKKVLLQHRAKGGSAFGVDPVAKQQAIEKMVLDATSCLLVSATDHTYACGNYNTDIPDLGVSDVEPKMFKAPYNVEPGATQLSSADLAKLTVKPTNGVIFGIPATTAVPAGTYFSTSAVAGMLSGDTQDWNTVNPAVAVGTPVVVCRRVQGSGTQATYNHYFNHFPCEYNSFGGTGTTPIADAQASASFQLGSATGTGTPADPFVYSVADGYTVVENTSSGNVRNCLAAAKAGGFYTFTGGDGLSYKVDFGAGGNLAIGVLSLDSLGKEGGNWSFRPLNGVDPTVADVNNVSTNGRDLNYDLIMEQSMQYNTTAYAAMPADKKTYIDTFIKAAGSPGILNGIASTSVQKSVLALPINGNTPGASATGDRVMKGTRYANSCSPIRKLF